MWRIIQGKAKVDAKDAWLKDDLGNPIDTTPKTIGQKIAYVGSVLKSSADLSLGVTKTKTEKVQQKIDADYASNTSNPYLQKLPTEDRLETLAVSPEYNFDYSLAKKNGFNSTQILDNLEGKSIYNISKAREAGLSDDDIVSHLEKKGRAIQSAHINQKLGVFSTSDVVKGAVKSLARVNAIEHDVAQAIGLETTKENQQHLKGLHQLHQAINDGMQDPNSFSSLVGEIAVTAPATAFNTAKWGLYGMAGIAGVQGGVHGYGNERLEGGSKSEALEAGALEATVGVGLTTAVGQVGRLAMYGYHKIAGKMSTKAKERALQMLQQEFDLTDNEMAKTTDEFLKMNKSSGDTDTDILIANITKHGKTKARDAVKRMINDNPDMLTTLKQNRTNRITAIMDEATKDGWRVTDVANEVLENSLKIKSDYSNFVTRIGRDNTYKKTYKFELPELDVKHFSDPSLKAVYDNIAHEFKQGMSLSDLLGEYKNLNEKIRTTSSKMGTRKNLLTELKTKVDDTIAQALDPTHYAEWQYVNNRYKDMAKFSRESKLGETLDKALKGEITATSLVTALSNANLGVKSFEALGELIGKGNMAKVEKAFISESIRKLGVDTDFSNLSYGMLDKSLASKGFITEEGKNLRTLIEHLKTQYSIDDVVRNMYLKHPKTANTDIGNRSSNMSNKLGSGLLSMLVENASRAYAGTNVPFFGKKAGSRLLSYDTLELALKQPHTMVKLKEALNEFPPAIVEEKLQTLFDKNVNHTGINFVQTTTKTDATYGLPYLTNHALKQHSVMKLAQDMPLSPKDIDKLMKLQGEGITNVDMFARQIEGMDLDLVRTANIDPKALAGAIHEHGMDSLLSGVQKATTTLDNPMGLLHYSSKKFNPSELKAGTQVKMLGKGTYFTDLEDVGNVAHKYEYTLPKGARVLNIPNKESYETLLFNLGLKDREALNEILKQSGGVDVITVNHNNRKTINILNNDLLDSVRLGHTEFKPVKKIDSNNNKMLGE